MTGNYSYLINFKIKLEKYLYGPFIHQLAKFGPHILNTCQEKPICMNIQLCSLPPTLCTLFIRTFGSLVYKGSRH